MSTRHCTIPSPIGPIRLLASQKGLCGLYLDKEPHGFRSTSDWIEDPEHFSAVRSQLDAYFAGKLREFDVALDLRGTPFQLRAWQALTKIPYGQTLSYGEQALSIDQPKAVRAIGLANGQNPVSIIVPCHRVIGKNGSLTGYGGGLERKRFLLDLEQRVRGLGAGDRSTHPKTLQKVLTVGFNQLADDLEAEAFLDTTRKLLERSR